MTEPKQDNDYIEHAKKATELLKRSVDVHYEELAGAIGHDEAVDRVVDLNERAAAEMDIAIDPLDKELVPE